jgi:intermediate peptidase
LAMRFIAEQQGKNPFGVLRNLLMVRRDLALMLGFESANEHLLQGSVLGTPSNVWHFLCGVAHKYRPEADKEVEVIRKALGNVKGRNDLTDEDRAKVAVYLRAQAEPTGVEQYFSVANCIRGIQCLCTEVFGLTLQQVPFNPEEMFEPDAIKFHVWDEQKHFVGVVVLDMFARASKHCQAGHLTVQLGCRPHVETMRKVGLEFADRQYPIVVLTCNAGSMTKAAKKLDGSLDPEATLMLPHEITTAFHEFGHAMHSLLGQTSVQNLAGTRASVDYVELFSQLFEQFLRSHEFLKLWAHKVDTREPIPLELVEKRNAAMDMFKHLDTLDQVVLSAIDQTLHGPQPFTVYFPFGGKGQLGKRTLGTMPEYGKGVFNFAKIVIDAAAPLSAVVPTERGVLRSLSFEHLSSYPAAYYGYLYSGAFAKRIWAKYFERNPLNREEGRKLANQLMCYGAACNPKEVLANYLKEDLSDVERWV